MHATADQVETNKCPEKDGVGTLSIFIFFNNTTWEPRQHLTISPTPLLPMTILVPILNTSSDNYPLYLLWKRTMTCSRWHASLYPVSINKHHHHVPHVLYPLLLQAQLPLPLPTLLLLLPQLWMSDVNRHLVLEGRITCSMILKTMTRFIITIMQSILRATRNHLLAKSSGQNHEQMRNGKSLIKSVSISTTSWWWMIKLWSDSEGWEENKARQEAMGKDCQGESKHGWSITIVTWW